MDVKWINKSKVNSLSMCWQMWSYFFLQRRENLWKSVAGFQYFVFLVFSVSWRIDISRSRWMTMTHPMPNQILTTKNLIRSSKQLLMQKIYLNSLYYYMKVFTDSLKNLRTWEEDTENCCIDKKLQSEKIRRTT